MPEKNASLLAHLLAQDGDDDHLRVMENQPGDPFHHIPLKMKKAKKKTNSDQRAPEEVVADSVQHFNDVPTSMAQSMRVNIFEDQASA